MNKEDFLQLKNFKINEKDYQGNKKAYGDIKKLSFDILKLLDVQTSHAKQIYPRRNVICVIHCATQGTHSENSQHYKGLAIDVHYRSLTLIEQIMLSLMFGWSAIGFYPTWKNKGLHLDLRQRTEYESLLMWYTKSVRDDKGKSQINYIYEKKIVLNKIMSL